MWETRALAAAGFLPLSAHLFYTTEGSVRARVNCCAVKITLLPAPRVEALRAPRGAVLRTEDDTSEGTNTVGARSPNGRPTAW
jgi:hypothetical protein